MASDDLLPSPALKLELVYSGVRYTEALGRAGQHAFPNFVPHRAKPGEYDPNGTGVVPIPYMLITEDDTHLRLRIEPESPWAIAGDREHGYVLRRDDGPSYAVSFEAAQAWMTRPTSDGVPGAMAGLSLHGDMAVVNVAPGCQYFNAPKLAGVSARCTFCTYGAPDARTKHLGQVMQQTEIPGATLARLQGVLADALEETSITTIYLVGGSMLDPAQEGERFVQLARAVQDVVQRRVPVTCGSGAIPLAAMRTLREERLVDSVCFNLEVWSKELFARVCPGKDRFVGYEAWLSALDHGVEVFGRGHVYSAMVGGIELGGDAPMTVDVAAELALEGADALCARGVIPIYSLLWPPVGPGSREYFERVQLGYADIREARGIRIWDGFMTHRAAYMQLECDIDRARAVERLQAHA